MRQQLARADVEFLVVHSTNTNIHQDLSIQDITEYRKKEGYPDIGFHYVIHRDGFLSHGVSVDQVGTHTSHFDGKSIGILLVGGKTTRGKPSDNYTPEQKERLQTACLFLLYHFDKAKLVGAGELLGGTEPHFDIGKLYDTSTSNIETPTE